MAKRSATVGISIQVEGADALKRALRVLAEPDAPFVRRALEESSEILQREASSRTHPSIAATVVFAGVRGKANSLRALTRFKHPGAKSREFGRKYYYRNFTDRRMKATGERFRTSGQPAKPFLGIVKGNGAVEAVRPIIEDKLTRAFEMEWDRITAAGDKD